MALSVAALTLLILAAAALAVAGQLTQLPGTAGCVSDTGSGGDCTDGKALFAVRGTAVSPDGKNLYSAGSVSNAVAVFSRSSTDGALTQLAGTAGCVSEDGSGGACADGKGLVGPISVAVSPDGKNVYVASQTGDGVAVFARNATTGELTQLGGTAGCVSQTGSGGACADGKALDDTRSVAVSADGKSVYVASAKSNAVAAFQRDATTGALTQLAGTAGCVSDSGNGGSCTDGKALLLPTSVTISPDDKHVYVSSGVSNAVAVFKRNTTTGALAQLVGPAGQAGCVSETGAPGGECADGKALESPFSVAVSGDGKHVYVASSVSDAVAVFRRDASSGVLTQLVGPAGKAGCVSEDGTGGACADGKALVDARYVALSPDGTSVYVAAGNDVAVFKRDTASGVLTQLAGTAGCVSEDGSGGACTDGKALDFAFSVAVSADGKSVYVGSEFSNAVAIFARETSP